MFLRLDKDRMIKTIETSRLEKKVFTVLHRRICNVLFTSVFLNSCRNCAITSPNADHVTTTKTTTDWWCVVTRLVSAPSSTRRRSPPASRISNGCWARICGRRSKVWWEWRRRRMMTLMMIMMTSSLRFDFQVVRLALLYLALVPAFLNKIKWFIVKYGMEKK